MRIILHARFVYSVYLSRIWSYKVFMSTTASQPLGTNVGQWLEIRGGGAGARVGVGCCKIRSSEFTAHASEVSRQSSSRVPWVIRASRLCYRYGHALGSYLQIITFSEIDWNFSSSSAPMKLWSYEDVTRNGSSRCVKITSKAIFLSNLYRDCDAVNLISYIFYRAVSYLICCLWNSLPAQVC